MSFYYRNICYIDYYENGNKCCNIGHVKWLVRDQACTITIAIRGSLLHKAQKVEVGVLSNGEDTGFYCRKLAEIPYENGLASKVLTYSKESIAGMTLKEIAGLHFRFADGKYGVALFQGNQSVKILDEYIPEPDRVDTQEERQIIQEKQTIQENAIEHDSQKNQQEQQKEDKAGVLLENQQAADSDADLSASEGCAGLCADKWQQLRKMYPHIHPLKNDQEYLSISPKDFVIFTNEYQRLVHNSFLLHGFYNYRHIILGKKADSYYIGVPGTYHEREAIVAEMFGFHNFEGVDGEENGAFGYYVTDVNI